MMHRFVALSVVAAPAVATPTFAQESATRKNVVALQCDLGKDGQVVARPSFRMESGGHGTISFRDEFTVTMTATRLDDHNVRLALTIEGAGKTIEPEIKFGDEQPGSVTFPIGKATYELKFSLVQ
jgi:hypothetical protein